MRLFFKTFKWTFLLFLLPALLAGGWWWGVERPSSWRSADWSSANILPDAAKVSEPVVHVLSARTGGMKGALAVHTWIVIKKPGASSYDRYEKVGWGTPVRKNAYAADGRWYSNVPEIVHSIRGEEAKRLIPKLEQAIASYPYSRRGGYTLWPGPNSNSFVAHVLRAVPEIHYVLPPTAVGRDFLGEARFFHVSEDYRDFKFSLHGLFGVSAGLDSGFELNFLTLVTGIDIKDPALKLPGFGRIAAMNVVRSAKAWIGDEDGQ